MVSGCNFTWQHSEVTLVIDPTSLVSRDFDGTIVPGFFTYSLEATEMASGSTVLKLGPKPLDQAHLEITLERGKTYFISLRLTAEGENAYVGFERKYTVPQSGEASLNMYVLGFLQTDAHYSVDQAILEASLSFRSNGPKVGSAISATLLRNGSQVFSTNGILRKYAGPSQSEATAVFDLNENYDDLGQPPSDILYTVPFEDGTWFLGTPLKLRYNFTENLFAEWLFENGSLVDTVGGRNLVAQGAPTTVSDQNGVSGSAYLFNTPGQYLTVDVGVLPAQLSLSFWLKPNDITIDSHSLFTLDNGNGSTFPEDTAFHIQHTGTGGFSIYHSGNTYSPSIGNPTPAIAANIWVHVAFSWNTSTRDYDFYYNGTEIMTDNTGGEISPGPTKTMFSIGSRYFALNGSLDNVRLYQRLLTQADVNGLYNDGSPR